MNPQTETLTQKTAMTLSLMALIMSRFMLAMLCKQHITTETLLAFSP